MELVMEGARMDFVGRRWVLERLDTWLGTSGRFFHLVGEPGSGKTALSRQLVQRSQSASVSNTEFPRLHAGFVDASHFCSARDRRQISPIVFAESLAAQLAARSQVYTSAMLRAIGAQTNVVRQQVELAENSTVIGVLIEQLNARGPSPEDAFDRLVREPLDALCRAEPAREILILVDALDESLNYRGDVGILPLLAQADDLPANVRFVLTSRPVPEIERKLASAAGGVERLTLSALEWEKENRNDIAEYVAMRLSSDAAIAPMVASVGEPIRTGAAAAINARANGNFLYAYFLLDAVANGRWKLEELANTPGDSGANDARGMDALYHLYMESLERVVDQGRSDWRTDYAPIMESLSAAQETLPRERLRAFAGQKESAFRTNLDNLRQFIETVASPSGEPACYRLFHQSFADFLRAPTVKAKGDTLDNPFHLAGYESHARVADCLAAAHGGDWGACEDTYALRYAAAHLAGASNVDAQPERHERSRALVELVTDVAFQQAHRTTLDDLVSLRGDFDRALAVAARDDHAHGPPLVVRAALALHALRREHARPATMFELAIAGDVDGAERRLALFSIDAAWRQAASLLIAWLATPVDLPAARALRDRVVHDGVDPALALLVARADVNLLGASPPSLPPLPPPPYEHQVVAILDRLGGGNHHTGIEPLDLERMHADAQSGRRNVQRAFIAETDGHPLVSFALHTGDGAGDEYFTRYIAAQSANGYEHYRNRSLWALIEPVLAHPDDTWTRRRLMELTTGALSPGVHFGQALPLTVLALQARAGNANATKEYEMQRDAARAHAATISPVREGDPWSHTLRRLVALAEIEALVHGRTDGARALVDTAMSLPFGFAGFNAKARLTLSECLRVLLPADTMGLESAFEMARRSAHNVQDYVFCARVTGRVEAMRLTWQATIDPVTLHAQVEALVRDPRDARFAARHDIGEQFTLRTDRANRLVIPDWALDAASLDELAALYDFPLAEFMRVTADHGWRADERLDVGTTVPVPDPDFPPLLAARFAADALAASSVPASRRTRLAQAIAPVAARNYTALDVVLSRMLLAALPSDAASLAHLAESVARYVPASLLAEPATLAPGLPA